MRSSTPELVIGYMWAGLVIASFWIMVGRLGVRSALLLSSFVALALFQNCSKAQFGASNSSSEVAGLAHQPGSCHTQLQQLSVPLRVLFIVDISGSNHNKNSNSGSDPNRAVRGGSIQTFLNDYRSKTNFSWGFEVFKGSSAQAYINYGALDSGRFSSASSDMQNALDYFSVSSDDGQTPYRAALAMAKQIISEDYNASTSTKYVVVFLSDGKPTDYSSDSSGDAELNADVQFLVGIRPGKISFNTIYYGTVDEVASSRLRNMAQAGSGEFLDTNSNPTGKSFYISDNINIPGVACP